MEETIGTHVQMKGAGHTEKVLTMVIGKDLKTEDGIDVHVHGQIKIEQGGYRTLTGPACFR